MGMHNLSSVNVWLSEATERLLLANGLILFKSENCVSRSDHLGEIPNKEMCAKKFSYLSTVND